jgi:nucleolar protein 4
MSERKRPRSEEDYETSTAPPSNDAQIHPPKKARKETNASARRSLFVRSLPAVATSEALTELFSQSYPLKHATVVIDPATKQSKGYGFVTFADAEDAQKAADEFNGHKFLGRRMKVEIAQPRSREMGPRDVLGGKQKSVISAESAALKKAREEKLVEDRKPPKLIIRNLPWSIKTSEQLAELFQKFGKVKHADMPKVKDTQAGFGFVVMRGRKNAEKALATVNGTMVGGRTLAVDWAVEKNVWESQKKSTEDNGKEESENGSDGGAELGTKKSNAENEEDDVANFMRNFGNELESEEESGNEDDSQNNDDDGDEDDEDFDDEESVEEKPQKTMITDNSTTLFVRNLPYTTLDPDLKEHFQQFGPVRYARVVMDRATDRPRGTGFVCFFNVEDADNCFRNAPRGQPTGANAIKPGDAPKVKHSLLENENADTTGTYTIEGRVLQVTKAVEKEKAVKLTEEGTSLRDNRDKDKRKLYLLSEGTVASGTPLYELLAPSEIKLREESAIQRKKLIQNNPTLHLSLTRLSIRNLPRNTNSKDLKALAREAVVGFAKDVKDGRRAQLSKEEEARGGDEMRDAEKNRKAKGKGIVRQSKIVFEGREGAKVSEESGAGRSRGYGFVEYSSHRWALMGLRWLNGHQLTNSSGKKQRLIVEFAIENAQVVQRRKEKEEKARVRSKEVQEGRERGELPEKEKKILPKSTLMKKTRMGTKYGVKVGKVKPFVKGPQNKRGEKGEEAGGKAGKGRSFVKGAQNTRGEKGEEAGGKAGKKASKKPEEVKKFKPGFPPGEEGRLARREQIVQKKRMMRRNRKKGGA